MSSIHFNADEIFTIAERIEENGAKFYRRAAENLLDPDVSRLLTTLAAAEDEHKATFASLRKSFKESSGRMVAESDDELIEEYLNAWADISVFAASKDPLDMLTGDETLEDILKIAIDAEKDSVIFYLSMKEAIKGESERGKIEKIIWEELHHHAVLTKKLARVQGKIT